MSRVRSLAPLTLLLGATSCAFLLDFDELQEGESATAGSAGTSAGSSGAAGAPALGGAGGSEDEGIPLSAAAAALADGLCDKLEECYGETAASILFDEEDCRAALTSTLANTIVATVESADYDPSSLPACLSTFAEADCADVTIAFPEECKRAFGGEGEDGAACAHSLECGEGLFCIGACPGTCSPALAQGEPCVEGDVCAPGTECFDGACAPLGAEDEECGNGVAPGCLTGLLCIGGNQEEGTPGRCFPSEQLFVVGEGQTCSFANTPTLCRESLSCPLLGAPQVCLAEAEPDGECDVTAVPDMCPDGQYCDGGTCTDLPASGETCRLVEPRCPAYHRCVNGRCSPLRDNGEACVDDLECYSGLCGAEGDCIAPQCP